MGHGSLPSAFSSSGDIVNRWVNRGEDLDLLSVLNVPTGESSAPFDPSCPIVVDTKHSSGNSWTTKKSGIAKTLEFEKGFDCVSLGFPFIHDFEGISNWTTTFRTEITYPCNSGMDQNKHTLPIVDSNKNTKEKEDPNNNSDEDDQLTWRENQRRVMVLIDHDVSTKRAFKKFLQDIPRNHTPSSYFNKPKIVWDNNENNNNNKKDNNSDNAWTIYLLHVYSSWDMLTDEQHSGKISLAEYSEYALSLGVSISIRINW